MRTKKSLLTTAAAVLGLYSLAPGLARAGFVPNLVSVSANGPNFDYVYQVDVSPGDRSDTNSFLVLYDFAGLVGSPSFVNDGVAFNGGRFSLTTQATGPTPPSTSPTDLAGLMNIVLTNTSLSGFVGPFPDVARFKVTSSLPASGALTSTFGSRAIDALNGGSHNFLGSYQGPMAIPEPPSFALLGAGLAGVFGYSWRKRRPLS